MLWSQAVRQRNKNNRNYLLIPFFLLFSVSQDPAGHLFMKQLLHREAEAQLAESAAAAVPNRSGNANFAGDGGGPWFADALLEQAAEELSAWAGTNRGGFVVAALEKVPSAGAEVRRVMGAKGARAQLVKDAKTGTSMGVKVICTVTAVPSVATM